MGAKVQFENYFSVLFPKENAKPDTRINNSLLEAWPHCAREIILKENGFYSNTKQGAMGLCSEKDMENLKLTMLKHEQIFKEQVRELHRLYRMQKLLMTDLRRKDSNTSTLTSGTVQEDSFPNHTGSELLKLDGKGNFWAALNAPITNKDSRDQQQRNSGVDYMQNYRSGLFEKNQQMGLSPREVKQNPRDFYNLQPSRAARLIFDLEQSADVYMDAEITNHNEEDNSKRGAFRNGVEPENDLQLTLKTGCEKAAKENGKQTGPYIQFNMSQPRREEVEEDKQLRCREEPILFPAVSTRSVTGAQEEWQSDSSDSRAKQRESRYAWPKEGILSGAVPQQRNPLFALVSSKGFLIDPSSTPMTSVIQGVSPGLSLNSHREMHPSGLWRKTEEGLCQIPHELHSQDFCIRPAESELQKQNFCPQDNYHAQPFVNSGSNRMNIKRQSSEYGMGNWYQNGNLMQHTQQDSPSIYHAGSPLIFGQALCQTGPVVGSMSNQQQGALHAMPASIPGSSGFPSSSLQECSRSLWSTSSIGFSPRQALDDKTCLDRNIQNVDLTLGLSSVGIGEARKNALCYSSAINRMEDAHTNSSGQVDATNKKLHQASMHMHGIDGQNSENFTRTFLELPSIQDTESDSVKHRAHLNGLDFSDLLKPLSESMQYIKAGDRIGLTKHLVDDLGERGAHQSKENIAFTSNLWKVHDITNEKEGAKSEAPQVEGGMLKPENLLGLVDKPMNNSTPVHGIIGKNPELKADRSHIDRHIHLHSVADSGEYDMKIGTFKENINAVYGPVKEEGFAVHDKFLSPVGDHVNTNMHEETTLVLGIRGKRNANKVSGQMEMESRYATSDKENIRAGSGSQASFAMRDPMPTEGVFNNGEMVDNFDHQTLVSDINPMVNVTRQGSIETENAFNFDQEKRKGSEEAACHSGLKRLKVSRDGTEKDAHAQQTDATEPSTETPKDNAQLSQYEADLEQSIQDVHMQRGSKFNIEPEVDTLQTKVIEGPSCSSPFLESARAVNSASRNSSVDTNVAANVLLKIASERILEWSDIDSCEFLFASGMKASLDWFADAVVSNANCVASTISGHREDTDHPLSSPRSGSNAKEPEVSEDSIPKENACSPNASSGLDFFESMTLMLEETFVDTDYKPLAKQEQEAEKTPSAINPILRQSKRGKRKRDRDFQKEIIPSISSLSRQEITEDMQIIGGLMRSAGDAWHTGSTRRTAGKFSLRDDWFVPLTGRRSRHISGFRANVGSITRNIDVQASRRHDQEVERVNALSWTSSWGETIRRRRMQRHRAPMTSLALNPV
jgi:hypothetical protein